MSVATGKKNGCPPPKDEAGRFVVGTRDSQSGIFQYMKGPRGERVTVMKPDALKRALEAVRESGKK